MFSWVFSFDLRYVYVVADIFPETAHIANAGLIMEAPTLHKRSALPTLLVLAGLWVADRWCLACLKLHSIKQERAEGQPLSAAAGH